MFEELIKAELKKSGLSEGLHTYIKVEKKEEIAAAVTALKGVLPEQKADAYAKLDEVWTKFPELKVQYDKELTAEGDRRVNDTKKMIELKKQESPENDLTDDEKKIKAIVGPMFDELKKAIAGQQQVVTVANRKNEAIELLKKEGLPETAIGLIGLESETAITDQVASVKAVIEKQTQTINDQLIAAGIKPGTGKTDGPDIAENTIKAAAEGKNLEAKGESAGFATKKF